MFYTAFENAISQYPELEINSHFKSSFISIFPRVDVHRSQAELHTEGAVQEKLLSLTGTSRLNLFIYSGQRKRSVLKYVTFYLSHARQRPIFLQESHENTYSLLTILVRIVSGNFDPCQITDNKHYFLLFLLPKWCKNSLFVAFSFSSNVSGHHNRCVNVSCLSRSSSLQLDAKDFVGQKFYSLDYN